MTGTMKALRGMRLNVLRAVLGLATVIALASGSAARAEWREASSDHFVIYANDSEKDLTDFAQKLERYHSAMEVITNKKVGKPSPSNRVTIFVVGSDRNLQQIAGSSSPWLGGFYIPRAGDSTAYIPNIRNSRKELSFSMFTLLHEYAHHFTLSTTTAPTPRWMGEGMAEFFASARFDPDGSVRMGRPDQHRAAELRAAQTHHNFGTRVVSVGVDELLDPEIYAAKSGKVPFYDDFYGRSWLLYHYLVFAPERKGQLQAYSRLLASGTSSLAAGKEAFGDLAALDDELDRYLEKGRMNLYVIEPGALHPGPVTLRTLSEDETAMMPVRIRSRRGVAKEETEKLAKQARSIAASHGNDPAVLTALAEAEYDAGHNDAAIAAADRAIAADPGQRNAYVQKGKALFRKAGDAPQADKAAEYRKARQVFLALNRLENDHPLPLIYYYRTYNAAGENMPPVAQQGLTRASELAPFDLGLHMENAIMLIESGDLEQAKVHLRPIAFSPHSSGLTKAAQKMLEALVNGTLKAGPFDSEAFGNLDDDEPAPPEGGSDAGEAE